MFKFSRPIVAIDIETTDSDSRLGSVIQIGAVLVDTEFEVSKQMNVYIKPLDSYHNPEARAVHGLTDEFLEAQGLPYDMALQEFESFANEAGSKPLLASWGNYFDIVFMQGYYAKLGRPWPFSRRSVDLKSIALWEMAKRQKEVKYKSGSGVYTMLQTLGLEFEGTPHNALDDIRNTVRILQEFKKSV